MIRRTFKGRAATTLFASIAALACSITLIAQRSAAHDNPALTDMSAQLYASPSQVRLVQQQLRNAGFEPGTVDGVWGERTSKAIQTLQKAKGLPQTRQLDTSVLSALDIGDVLQGQTSSKFLDGLLKSDARDSKVVPGVGTPLYVSPAHVAQIQHVLREKANYTGKDDGTWGPETAAAANRFRAAQGLDSTPFLDVALLQAMNHEHVDVPNLTEEVLNRTAGVPLYAGTSTIRALQRELSQAGHDAGAIDGVWGDNTRDALRAYQRAHGLETTGTLTLPTLAALGINVASDRQPLRTASP